VTEIEASWIGSLMPLAALIGGFAGGPLLELIGRKLTILLTAPPFIVAGLMVTYADSVGIIYAGRSVTGFCIGYYFWRNDIRQNDI
jgi:facilitated trehalose transporter